MAERFRAVNKAVSSWDGEALAELVPALEDLAEHAASLTEAFACLPEQYQDNLVSVADLVFVSRSLERIAEGLQKVAAEGLLRGLLMPRACTGKPAAGAVEAPFFV